MIILDNKFAKASYHEDGNYILFEYKKFGTSVVFREAWNKVAEIAEQYQVNKWLSDSRTMAVISTEDQKWFSEEWSPKVRMLIPKDTFTAIVLDKGAFTEMSAKSISQNITGQNTIHDIAVTFEFFKDIEAAKDWLKNVEYQLAPLAR